MAHLAVETLLAQTAREVAAKDNNETDDTLREFGKCAVSLRHALYQDRSLTTMEFHFMDNHFQVLQMAYVRWKRKHSEIPTD
jgi:hypothetical protein